MHPQSFENRYDLRAWRAFRCRSAPCARSMNTVLTHQLTADHSSAAAMLNRVPNTARAWTLTTRLFWRVLCTVA